MSVPPVDSSAIKMWPVFFIDVEGRIGMGIFCQTGLQRIVQDVVELTDEFGFAPHDPVVRLALPDLTAVGARKVDEVRGPSLNPLHDLAQRIRFVGREQKMDMIGHDHRGVEPVEATIARTDVSEDEFCFIDGEFFPPESERHKIGCSVHRPMREQSLPDANEAAGC